MTTNNSFFELASKRRSVRGYMSQPVSDEDIDYIIKSSLIAPSAVNRQPWHLFVVRDADAKAGVCEAYPGREWLAAAPVHIIVCVDDAAAWVRQCDGHSHADIDAAIITEHICLAAADRGLGTCWICNFAPDILTEKLNLPANLRPVAIIPVGYATEDSTRPMVRRDASETVTYI